MQMVPYKIVEGPGGDAWVEVSRSRADGAGGGEVDADEHVLL